MAAPTLFTSQGGKGDRLSDGEQVAKIKRGVPARVVLAMSIDRGVGRSVSRNEPMRSSACDISSPLRTMANHPLHQLLQIVLNLVRAIRIAPRLRAPFKRFESLTRRGIDLFFADVPCRMLPRILGGVFAGPFAEDKKIRK